MGRVNSACTDVCACLQPEARSKVPFKTVMAAFGGCGQVPFKLLERRDID
jgi:hypothetical protein